MDIKVNKEELKRELRGYKQIKGHIENLRLAIMEKELDNIDAEIIDDLKKQKTKQEIRLKRIDNALNSLPEKQKEIIGLFDFEQLTWLEISFKKHFAVDYCRQVRIKGILSMLDLINNKEI